MFLICSFFLSTVAHGVPVASNLGKSLRRKRQIGSSINFDGPRMQAGAVLPTNIGEYMTANPNNMYGTPDGLSPFGFPVMPFFGYSQSLNQNVNVGGNLPGYQGNLGIIDPNPV